MLVMTDILFDLRIFRLTADELLNEVEKNAKTPLEVALATKLEEALNEISNLQFELEEADARLEEAEAAMFAQRYAKDAAPGDEYNDDLRDGFALKYAE